MRVAFGVGSFALGLYGWTACRTVTFGDAGELITAAYSLGVAHPPGYPLYTLLGRFALAVIPGEAAWAMNLLSALFGALACGGLAWLGHRFTRSWPAGAAAGLGLAVAAPFWSAATMTEVYTLHLAVSIVLLCVATLAGAATEPAARSRWLLLAALVLGLGLSHRPTIVLALPAAWWLYRVAGSTRRGGGHQDARDTQGLRWRLHVASSAVLLGVPLLLYGTLILRAQAAPILNWGNTVDLERLIAHVTTRAYGHYAVGPEGWTWARSWVGAGEFVWRALGPVGIVFACMGLFGLLQAGLTGLGRRAGSDGRSARWRCAILLWGLPGLLFALSYATPDVEVLFIPLLPALFLAVAGGVVDAQRCLTTRFGKGWPFRGAVLGALVLAVALPQLVRWYGSHDLREVTAARDYAEDMLASVPARGVLFVEGDDAFLLAYMTRVLHQRTDITIYDRTGLVFRDETTEAGSAPRAGESGPGYRVRREKEFIVREVRGQRPRPVLFMSWPGYELPVGMRFEPEGLFYRVRLDSEPRADPSALWRGYRDAEIREQSRSLADPLARTVAATYALMRGERARFEGDREAALMHFDDAGSLGGNSESIHNYLGTVFGRLGDYQRAVREFRRALQVQPVSVRAWNNLALAYSLAGDRGAAAEALRQSLRLRPNQVDARRQLEQLED